MSRIIKVLLGVMATILLIGVIRFFFSFPTEAAQFGFVAEEMTTMQKNTLQSDVAGMLLLISSTIWLYIFKGRQWLWPAYLTCGAVFDLRLISFLFGNYDQGALILLGGEAVILTLLTLQIFVFDKAKD